METLPNWIPHRQVSLGLDLQGGSYILLEVDLDRALAEYTDSLLEEIRGVLREKQIAFTNLSVENGSVAIALRDVAQASAAREAIRTITASSGITEPSIGKILVRPSEAEITARKKQIVDQSVEIVRRRVDETGTKESSIQRQGDRRVIVELPGYDDPQRMKELIGKTAKLTFHLVEEPGTPGTKILDSEEAGGGKYTINRRIIVSGENLTDAQPTYVDGQPVVSFRFDSTGARRFGDATQKNVHRFLAIVLDDKVISAPTIREPILGGSGIISGHFTPQSASDLALLLRAGALPAPLKVLEERTVGPGLGADSIAAGTVACLIGYGLIALLMVIGYGLFGIFANIALLLNLAFTLAIMALLGATLTLPGIAGIVLGLAMAVDANVLIFERMREEVRFGRSPFPAVDNAFQRAYVTILDSNVTTLIAAIILYILGTGAVRGFAVTLAIGIAASMFTAVTVSRFMVVSWLVWRRPAELPL
ncbi:MAG: protein translocase subunit SecD [Alphaproteobacteria bacterium]